MERAGEYEIAAGRRPSRRSQPSQALYDQERHSRGSKEAAHYGGRRQYLEKGQHGSLGRQQHRPKVLLDDAVYDLQNVLETAVDCYSSFFEEFEKDVQRIEAYAGPRVMEHLWVNKVESGSERSRNGIHSQARQAAGQRPPTPAHNFRSVGKEVDECFHVAMGSHASSKESHIDPQTAVRIQKKLKQAYGDISKLMETALWRKDDAGALITELEMVLTFLEKTGPRRDEREGSVDHHGQDPQHFKNSTEDDPNGFKEAQGM